MCSARWKKVSTHTSRSRSTFTRWRRCCRNCREKKNQQRHNKAQKAQNKFFICAFCAFLWLSRSGRRRRTSRLLHILLIPRQVSLHPIALVTRALDSVVLVWIDDKLCVDPETAKRLV